MRTLLLALLAVGLLGGGCRLPDDSLSAPDPLPEGPSTSVAPPPAAGEPGTTPVLGSPAASPTPEPEGGEGETPPEPQEPNTPPPGDGCGDPAPPPITRVKVTTHLRGEGFWTLDATPLVGPDADYCASIGFTDGRENCPVRPEGHPEREACEAGAVGKAVDTGRPGGARTIRRTSTCSRRFSPGPMRPAPATALAASTRSTADPHLWRLTPRGTCVTFDVPPRTRDMRRHRLHALIPALAFALMAAACTSGQEEPTKPDALAGRNLIPEAPLGAPSPSPTPDETGTLPANPGGGGVGGGAIVDSESCGSPTPPPIARLNVKVLSTEADRALLDATPLVGPDPAYCAQVGYTDGRLFCAVRPEGHPERSACEVLRVGRANDTGRIGPTWSAGGRPCQGRTEETSCLNHPDNQFLAFAFGTGTFEACVGGGACGQTTVR